MTISRKTVSVVEAGRILGVGRNAAYEAARTGQIPTIRIGKKIIVSIAAIDKMLSAGPEPVSTGGGRA